VIANSDKSEDEHLGLFFLSPVACDSFPRPLAVCFLLFVAIDLVLSAPRFLILRQDAAEKERNKQQGGEGRNRTHW
jgi:hypothetical protein